MSTAVHYPHLVTDPDGTARIAHTRYQVRQLAGEHLRHGWTAEEILRRHPDLRPGQVYAALAYFYDHYEAMILDLQDIDGPGTPAARVPIADFLEPVGYTWTEAGYAARQALKAFSEQTHANY